MDEYLIVHCGRCGATWALDFEPQTCTCADFIEHPDDAILSIEAEDYESALEIYKAEE